MNFLWCACFILDDSQFILTSTAHVIHISAPLSWAKLMFFEGWGQVNPSYLQSASLWSLWSVPPASSQHKPHLPGSARSVWAAQPLQPKGCVCHLLCRGDALGSSKKANVISVYHTSTAEFEGHECWQLLCRICTDIQVCLTPSTICVHQHKTTKATCPSNIHWVLIFCQDISFLEHEGAKPFPWGVQVPKQWTGSHLIFFPGSTCWSYSSTLQSLSLWIFPRIRLMSKPKPSLLQSLACVCFLKGF